MNYLKFLHDARILQSPEDGGEGGDGGGGAKAPEPKTPVAAPGITQEQLDAAVSKAVSDNNNLRDAKEAGLKKNKEELHTEKKALQQQLKDNENAIRMRDGNVGEVTTEIDNRLKGEYKEKFAEQQKEIENYKTAAHNKSIEAFVNELVIESNIKPALQRARKLEILADGKIETDESGNMTIDGRNPKEFVSNWLENGQNVNDYVLAPSSSGGGAKGGKTGAGATGHVQILSSLEGADLFAAASKLVHDNK